MQYLIVILDESAKSFCYYPNPKRKPGLMDLDLLKKIILFAQKEGLLINFLVGETQLPREYIETIDVINHILITPEKYPLTDIQDVLVLDYTDRKPIIELPENCHKNIILRIDRKNISSLSEIITSLKNKFLRINISVQSIDQFTDSDFELYKQELEKLSELFCSYDCGRIELNVLSDRLFLHKMNNCEAVVKHITVAPNGKFYICPAFYYEDDNDSIGDIGSGLEVKNPQLYKLAYAPICRNCDAYHCKRCIWLNRKTTLEVNTPSHEQCVVAHLERNESINLLSKIRENGEFLPETHIKELDYLDPFEVYEEIKRNKIFNFNPDEFNGL